MNLTPGISISRGDVVTRQTIFDVLALAPGTVVVGSDLVVDVRSVITQSEAPTSAALFPGQLWFDQTDQLMKVWTDVIDGTGASIFLSMGPDRFDTAMIAAEPLPFGAAVQLSGNGRYARLPPSPAALVAMGVGFREWEVAKVVGFNNQGTRASPSTTASGAWFACAADGLPWVWLPAHKDTGGAVFFATRGGTEDLLSLIYELASPAVTFASGVSDVRGGLVWENTSLNAGNPAALANSVYRVPQFGDLYARVFFGPRVTKHT